MPLPVAMGWRHLLFANWSLEPDVVAAHLPASLSVDTFDGRAWLSVVPFVNVDVRPRGVPALAGFPLPELNLRTYVTRDGESGVYFFSLDAAGSLGVLGARLFHHLPYYYARMRLRRRERDGRIRFTSRRRHPGERPVLFDAIYRPTGEPFTAESGSLAAFLTERYRYYTEDSRGRLRYADVDHEPWTLRDATATLEDESLFRANGFTPPEGSPVCYYSRGLEVTASRCRRWQ
ncbi:YqjF family protein [Natronobeatus ordinarius]|uniref:YqjF family protein n=1 Tax=Natronobeatus ordinarius TaxID=2963433 RepID=UPI0020CD3E5A|nr:DUF2071 domain-containing protein [Natronobeatus ordinarius]